MRKRRPNYRLVKIHRNYTVEEVARLFGTHKNTVRAWVKSGLPTCDSKRPMLILGRDLRAYLQARRTRRTSGHASPAKSTACDAARQSGPPGTWRSTSRSRRSSGNLEGICPDCGGMMYRRASKAKLPEIRAKLDITFTEAERRVSESNVPTVNSDFSQG